MLEKYRLISRNDTSRFAIIPGMKHIVVALRYSIPSGQHIWRGIRRYVADHCFGQHEGAIPEIQCAMLGNEAGIIGAAAL